MKSTDPVSFPMPQVADNPAPAGPMPAPAPIRKEDRCQHRTPSGRRCRQACKNSRSRFCQPHHLAEQNRHNGDRLSELLPPDNDLFSAKEVNASLFSLYLLLAQDRISPRRAAVLAYIASLMVRNFPAVEKEASHETPRLILDFPRPQAPAEPEPDTHPAAPAAVVAGLQTRSTSPSEDVVPSLPAAAGNARDLLFSSPPAPAAVPTPSPTPPPQPHAPVITYRDPNYDDHWFPTSHIVNPPTPTPTPSPTEKIHSGTIDRGAA